MGTPAAEAHLNKIKDLLLGQDVSGQVELLLNLLSDAAAGKELSNVVSEVIQVGGTRDLIWALLLREATAGHGAAANTKSSCFSCQPR